MTDTRNMRKTNTNPKTNNTHPQKQNMSNQFDLRREYSVMLKVKPYSSDIKTEMYNALLALRNINNNVINYLENTPNEMNLHAAVVYNKAIQFLGQFKDGCYNNVQDGQLLNDFADELLHTINLLHNYVLSFYRIKINIDNNESANAKLEKNTTKRELPTFQDVRRSRRKVQRVDYTGMDTIEPESEFDGITDIWYDLTLQEDPDYVPEQDDF
jgi:hypothetical protein